MAKVTRPSRLLRSRTIEHYDPARTLIQQEGDAAKRLIPVSLLMALVEANKDWHLCPGCGVPLRRNKYCSARCANRDTSRLYEHRKRAAKNAVPLGEVIVALIDIAERDGWRCHICRRQVELQDASLDHLIPLSKGGPHTVANVALAHRRCNSRRGAGRLPAQLRLE